VIPDPIERMEMFFESQLDKFTDVFTCDCGNTCELDECESIGLMEYYVCPDCFDNYFKDKYVKTVDEFIEEENKAES